MYRSISSLFLGFLLSLFLVACSSEPKTYTIGVSQCSDDLWRSKLASELEQSTFINDDVQLVYRSANDDVQLQKRQIEELIAKKVDLLIISPQQEEEGLKGVVAHAKDQNIPVIFYDRKIEGEDYTAFMGADNYRIGKMMGEFAANRLHGRGCIVEIGGLHGSSPATERTQGFRDAIKPFPELKVVGFVEGDWKMESAEKVMGDFLKTYDGPIDCVFAGNDRMAVGARHAIEAWIQQSGCSNLNLDKMVFLGIDALPMLGCGLEDVRDGVLTASAIYPTHGMELISLALNILKKKPYAKINDMETSIVTTDNANMLLLQYREVMNQADYIKKLEQEVDDVLQTINMQRFFIWFIVLIVVVVTALLIVSLRAYHTKKHFIEELSLKNEELNREKAVVEHQRDELEEQRDRLLDATTKIDELNEQPVMSEREALPAKNEFMEKFFVLLDNRMEDPNLSVEDISQELALSRVQLYRKVKALTGKTPVEIVRQRRLERGHALLENKSLSVSEVAYSVGFSAPSYFTKCYKDYYGEAPSDIQK